MTVTFNYSTLYVLPFLIETNPKLSDIFQITDKIYTSNPLHTTETQATIELGTHFHFKNKVKNFIRGDRYISIVEIDDKFKADYLLFKQSKYSKLSEEGKGIIISFWKRSFTINDPTVKMLYGMFNKEEKLFKYWEDLINISISREQEAMPLLGEQEVYI